MKQKPQTRKKEQMRKIENDLFKSNYINNHINCTCSKYLLKRTESLILNKNTSSNYRLPTINPL